MYRPHRAWAVCAGGAIMLFTAMGLVANVFSVYQPYVIRFNSFTNTQGSWITTIRSLFILLGTMSATWLCARFGLRRTATFALSLIAFAYVIFGLAEHFSTYCFASAIAGLGYAWGGMIPLSLLINQWFQDRQAFALGLAGAGSGLSTIIAPAPLTWLIESYGLSATFWCEAVFILFMALLVFLLVRDRPEDVGLLPYRTSHIDETAPPAPSPAPAGLTPLRWKMVLAAVFLLAGPTGIGISHLGVLYTTEGYAPDTVAALVSCMGICLIVGKLAYGEMVDRLGGRWSNYIIYSLSLSSFLLCCLAPLGGKAPAFLAMIIFGMGLPVSNVALSVWAKDFCGDAGFSEGLKWSQTIFGIGLLLAGPIPGMLADLTGSYAPAYFLFFLMMLVSMILMSLVYEKTKAGRKPQATQPPPLKPQRT